MSRDFTPNQELHTTGSPSQLNITAGSLPISIACWIRPDDVSVDRTMVAKYNGHGPLFRFNSGKLGLFTVDLGQSGREAIGATTVPTGQWSHAGGAFDGSSTLRVMLNGVQNGTAACGSQDSPSAADWYIGARPGGTNFFDGLMAHVAIWNVYLNDGEWLSLAKGMSPLLVRPSALKGYWPLWGSTASEPSYAGGLATLTNNATTLGPTAPPVMAHAVPTLIQPKAPGASVDNAIVYLVLTPSAVEVPPPLRIIRQPMLMAVRPDNTGEASFESADAVWGSSDLAQHLMLRLGSNNAAQPTVKHGIYGAFRVPKDYVGLFSTPQVVVEWTATVVSGDVVFSLDYNAVGNDAVESLDPSGWQRSITVTDTVSATARRKSTAALALTASDLAPDDIVEFYFSRDGAAAGDTMAGSAWITDLIFEYSNV